jgi:hypothetical protein
MGYRELACVSFAVLLLFLAGPQFGSSASTPDPNGKNIWNYDGGLVMMSDGSIPDGPCFRVSGRLTAPQFFDNLKRIDTKTGVVIHRGNDLVTEFPGHMHLAIELYDMPCSAELVQRLETVGHRVYLTRAIISSMHLNFYWKHGLELRRADGVKIEGATAQLVEPYAASSVKDLPEKYQWFVDFDVPSAGVPVTDSLVLMMTTSDNHLAARVAARM